jgi:hypothetical protein
MPYKANVMPLSEPCFIKTSFQLKTPEKTAIHLAPAIPFHPGSNFK